MQCKAIARCIRTIFTKIMQCSQKVELCQKKISGNHFLSTGFFYVFFFFILTWLIYVILTRDAPDIASPPAFADAKKYIADNLILGSIIFTAYGIIFLQIKNPKIIIFLFLVQAVPCIFVVLRYSYVIPLIYLFIIFFNHSKK